MIDFMNNNSSKQESDEKVNDNQTMDSAANEAGLSDQSEVNHTDQIESKEQMEPSDDTENMEQIKNIGEESGKIGELSLKLDALTELFKTKIETDEYKNHLFDEMHKQLSKYQDDVLKSVIEPFISELITLLENVKQYERFTPEEATPENYTKLRKRLSDVRGDIEDLLEEMDVSKYETDDVIPDTKRQKIIKTVRTDDVSKNNTIESKLSDGYIYRNKIMKYEKVAVYKAE